MPNFGDRQTGRTKYGTAAGADIPKPKTPAQLAKELDVIARRIEGGKGKPGDEKLFDSLYSQWGKQKYVPKSGLDPERTGSSAGTFGSIGRDEYADGGGTGGGKYALSYKSLQAHLDERNNYSMSKMGRKIPPPVDMPKLGNNKGGLAKKTKGFKQGGLAGQGHNDMRKGGLFK